MLTSLIQSISVRLNKDNHDSRYSACSTVKCLLVSDPVSYFCNRCKTVYCVCTSIMLVISSYCDGLVNACRYWCNCSGTGYFGDTCESEINECDSSPCQHNATCIDLVAVCCLSVHFICSAAIVAFLPHNDTSSLNC